jgi:cation diffusion facilitator family transporter
MSLCAVAASGAVGRKAPLDGRNATMHGGSKESSTRTAVIAGGVDTLISLGALLAAQSSVLLADFMKTGLEFFAVVLAWLAMRRLAHGGGTTYEYGIGKLENLSSLMVAALMAVVFLVISANAVRGLLSPSHVGGIGVVISLVAQVVYAGINGWLWSRCRQSLMSENSPLMASQAKLFFTKLFGNVFILLSLSLSLLLADYEWSVLIDPIASLVIASSILISAVGVFSSSVYDLLDGTLEEKDKLDIMRELVLNFTRYDRLYGVRSRRSGKDVFIDIHLGFDPEQRVGDVERDIESIRAAVARRFKSASVTIVLGPERKPGEGSAATA